MHGFCELINYKVRRVSECAYAVFRVLLTFFFVAKHQTIQAPINFKITIFGALFAKLRRATISFLMSVHQCPLVTRRLPLDRFS